MPKHCINVSSLADLLPLYYDSLLLWIAVPSEQKGRQAPTHSVNYASRMLLCMHWGVRLHWLSSSAFNLWAHLVVIPKTNKSDIFSYTPGIHNQMQPRVHNPYFSVNPLHVTYIRVHNIYSWLFHSQTSIFVTELIWTGRLVHPRGLWKVLKLRFTSCNPNNQVHV